MHDAEPEAADNLTVDYRPREAGLPRVPAALPADSGLATAEDLRALLQRRLRFLCLLLAVLYGVGVFFHLAGLQQGPPGLDWIGKLGGSFAVLVVLTSIVWSRPALSLGRLRAIELAIVVLLVIRIVVRGQVAFWHPASQELMDLAETEGHLQTRFIDTSNYICYPAALFILAYGVCIPNTWRRCLLVVAALWSVAPIVYLIGLIDNDLAGAWKFRLGNLNAFLYLTAAAALAVYGSHRFETLRRAEVQARRLGQYVLKERLGGGGMGEVFLAHHLLLRRPCALKLVRPERAGDPAMLERFEREVQTTATLTHPNTVQIFDYGHTPDGTFYYVMEYLPGLTLEEVVWEHGPLPPARAVHFLRQLCGALQEAHAIGLIHRDIKPGNVMICERGGTHDVAKLLDFGLVQTSRTEDGDDRLTRQGAVIGTPQFMSPEQAGSGDAVDPRSDIYSLGALGYFLLSGRPVFAGGSPVKTLAAHLYETPGSLAAQRAEVPPELEAIVLRCLAKKPADRFPNVRSLAAALAECRTIPPWTEEAAAGWWALSGRRTGISDQPKRKPGSSFPAES